MLMTRPVVVWEYFFVGTAWHLIIHSHILARWAWRRPVLMLCILGLLLMLLLLHSVMISSLCPSCVKLDKHEG